MPYGYYQLLRLCVAAVTAFLAALSYACDRDGWAWTFGATALLYQPFVKVSLGPELWSIVNVLTIVLLYFHMRVIRASSTSI
jgi:hypothetical protein